MTQPTHCPTCGKDLTLQDDLDGRCGRCGELLEDDADGPTLGRGR